MNVFSTHLRLLPNMGKWDSFIKNYFLKNDSFSKKYYCQNKQSVKWNVRALVLGVSNTKYTFLDPLKPQPD